MVPIRATSEVTSWDPPTFSEFKSVSLTWPFRMIARHRFEELPDSDTEYTWSIVFEEVNVIARPLIALTARLFTRTFAAQSKALHTYLAEYPPEQPPPLL